MRCDFINWQMHLTWSQGMMLLLFFVAGLACGVGVVAHYAIAYLRRLREQ